MASNCYELWYDRSTACECLRWTRRIHYEEEEEEKILIIMLIIIIIIVIIRWTRRSCWRTWRRRRAGTTTSWLSCRGSGRTNEKYSTLGDHDEGGEGDDGDDDVPKTLKVSCIFLHSIFLILISIGLVQFWSSAYMESSIILEKCILYFSGWWKRSSKVTRCEIKKYHRR